MGTKAKICTGYTNHMDEWCFNKIYYSHYDGNPDNILNILKNKNIGLDDVFEVLLDFNNISGVDYIYYIDDSNKNKWYCTVLEYDWIFYGQYYTDSYRVIQELVINR